MPDEQSRVVRSEDEYRRLVACTPEGGEPVPSDVDWSTHELFVYRAWYQGNAGSFVRMLDTGDGRVAQFHRPNYCGGAAPPEGHMVLGVVLPRREAGAVSVIGCDNQPCDWEINGSGPPP